MFLGAVQTRHLRCHEEPAGPGVDSSMVRLPEQPEHVIMPPYFALRVGEEGGRAELGEAGALKEWDRPVVELEKMPLAASDPSAPPPGRWTFNVLFVGGAAPEEGLNCRTEGAEPLFDSDQGDRDGEVCCSGTGCGRVGDAARGDCGVLRCGPERSMKE